MHGLEFHISQEVNRAMQGVRMIRTLGILNTRTSTDVDMLTSDERLAFNGDQCTTREYVIVCVRRVDE